MNCDSIYNLLPDYKDGTLSPKTKQAIDEHLSVCPRCSEALEFLGKSETLLSDMPRVSAPADLRQNTLRSIRKSKASLFDVFFGVGHSPFRAGFAVGAALLVLAVVSVNVVNISGKTAKYETYKTANVSSVYSSQFNLEK